MKHFRHIEELVMGADRKGLEQVFRELLLSIGEDPKREGLLRTPERAAQAMLHLVRGYGQDLKKVVNGALYHEPASGVVTVRGIQFFSLCEHHLLPFFGEVTVAYLPGETIIGLSKIARIVEMYSRRLQVQERLTQQIVDGLGEVLKPRGAACIIQASHLCMMMRGVEQVNSLTATMAFSGEFDSNMSLRREFLNSAGVGSHGGCCDCEEDEPSACDDDCGDD